MSRLLTPVSELIERRVPPSWAEVREPGAWRTLDTQARMTALAETFHSMVGKPGVRPWSPIELAAWCRGPAPSPSMLNVACFLLEVWNSRPHDPDWPKADQKREWWPKLPRFSLVEARQRWDGDHWAALQAWVRDPWTA